MDKRSRAHLAQLLANDEIWQHAVAETKSAINRDMLNADNPRTRDSLWHEYHALERAVRRLRLWAAETEDKPQGPSQQ